MKADTNKTVKTVVELPQAKNYTSTELQKQQKTSELTLGQRLADLVYLKSVTDNGNVAVKVIRIQSALQKDLPSTAIYKE
ncbi:hypothetical protein NUACC21_61840 [Scytonema sp. NUACC21]